MIFTQSWKLREDSSGRHAPWPKLSLKFFAVAAMRKARSAWTRSSSQSTRKPNTSRGYQRRRLLEARLDPASMARLGDAVRPGPHTRTGGSGGGAGAAVASVPQHPFQLGRRPIIKSMSMKDVTIVENKIALLRGALAVITDMEREQANEVMEGDVAGYRNGEGARLNLVRETVTSAIDELAPAISRIAEKAEQSDAFQPENEVEEEEEPLKEAA